MVNISDFDDMFRRPFLTRSRELVLAEWRTAPRAFELNATVAELKIVLDELRQTKARCDADARELEQHIQCVEVLYQARCSYESELVNGR